MTAIRLNRLVYIVVIVATMLSIANAVPLDREVSSILCFVLTGNNLNMHPYIQDSSHGSLMRRVTGHTPGGGGGGATPAKQSTKEGGSAGAASKIKLTACGGKQKRGSGSGEVW